MSKVVLITGGAGFIGRHLTQTLLTLGYKVRILDPLSAQIHGEVPSGTEWLQGIDFIRGSVTDRALVVKALEGVSSVVHLAAETGTGQSMYEIQKYTDVNVGGTSLLLDVLANSDNHTVERFLLASSRSVYGEGAYSCTNCPSNNRVYPLSRPLSALKAYAWNPLCGNCGGALEPLPTKECDAVNPASIYASTKYAQEDLVKIACTSMGIGFGILRLQNVYGQGQSLNNPYTGILSIFSTRVRRNLMLPIFEDGLETRDFVHVQDVVNTMEHCLRMPEMINDIVNVGSGIASSVFDVASMLNKLLGGEVDISVTKQFRLGDIRHNFADTAKLTKTVGYTPKVSLEEGLKQFVSWVVTQPLPEDRLDSANNELKARNMMG